MPFLVIFMNCTGGHDCRTLQYYMGFSDARQVPLERFNEWNREKRFARAYRDESGDPVLEMDVDFDFSVLPRENIRETLNTWASLMSAYREFIFAERRSDDRNSTRLNSTHYCAYRMPSSAGKQQTIPN